MYHGLGLFNFVRNFSVRFSMRELGRETEKYSWQSFTVFISVVRKLLSLLSAGGVGGVV